MKKGFVLLSVLISLQLCGCADRAAEVTDAAPSAAEAYTQETEALPAEPEETEEPVTSEEEIADENSDLSTAQGDDPASIQTAENTENAEIVENPESTDAAAQDTVPQPEETAASDNDSYYSAATDIPRDEVEGYAARIKQQFLDHDWPAIASEISYPVTIADMTFHDSTEFLDASESFDGKLQENFFEALEKEDCVEMFCSWEGIMLGETGEIWISEVLDADLNSQGLKIVAINGLLTK